MKKLLTLLLLISVCEITNAQALQWARPAGSTGTDNANCVKTDASSNVYVVGRFQGTVDFDPGPIVNSLTAVANYDFFVLKLNSSGGLVWVKGFGGTLDEEAYSLDVNSTGSNILITGRFASTTDFDPNAGVVSVAPLGASGDMFILNLDASGNYVWVKQFASSIGRAIDLDASDNIYVTGGFGNVVDFDPGPGTFNLTAPGSNGDAFVLKLDASANFVWAKSFTSTNTEQGVSLARDAFGNIYTMGSFNGTADFDPGAGTFNMTPAGLDDIYISKLDANGNLLWAKRVGGTSIDQPGTLYCGSTGDIFYTGSFLGTGDFDPNGPVLNLTSNGSFDMILSRIDFNGVLVWAKNIGAATADAATGLVLDNSDNCYITGYYSNTVDFDPGAGTYNMTFVGGQDIFILKLDGSSNFGWAISMGSGLSSELGTSIDLDNSGGILLAGSFSDIADFDPTVGVTNLSSNGLQDMFVAKYATCASAPTQPGGITGNITLCAGSNNTYSVTTVAGALDYTWTLPGGWSGTSTTNSINTTAGTSGGTITVTANNACGSSTAQTLNVTVNTVPAQPSSITGNVTMCEGTSQPYSVTNDPGATSYTWTLPATWTGSSTTNSINSTVGTSGGTISVTANNSCGSSTSQTLNVTVNSLPTVNVTLNATSVCVDNAVFVFSGGSPAGGTFSGTGVTGGNFNAATAGVGTHTITYSFTDGNGCTNSNTDQITVNNCTGISNVEISNVEIYPNPTNGIVTLNGIEGCGNCSLVIYSVLGYIIYQSPVTNAAMTINIHDADPGMYFVQIKNESITLIKKLVKN